METKKRRKKLIDLYNKYKDCTNCRLGVLRKNFVFGTGNPDANILFIGEAPGAKEDAIGKPFVGRAGLVLTKALESIGIDRSQIFIANILKCRPPGNRDPLKDEISTCRPILDKQIEYIRPNVIVCLGRVSVHTLLNINKSMKDLRGLELKYNTTPVFVTYHPAATLYNPTLKDTLLTDFKTIKTKYLDA